MSEWYRESKKPCRLRQGFLEKQANYSAEIIDTVDLLSLPRTENLT
jgi:hypothetical protein